MQFNATTPKLTNEVCSIRIYSITRNIDITKSIWNYGIWIKLRGTKKELPQFFAELKTAEYNKEVYKIDKLLQSLIKFEPTPGKRELPQCAAECQRFGYRTAICVNCMGKYSISLCQQNRKLVTFRVLTAMIIDHQITNAARYIRNCDKGCFLRYERNNWRVHIKYERNSISSSTQP